MHGALDEFVVAVRSFDERLICGQVIRVLERGTARLLILYQQDCPAQPGWQLIEEFNTLKIALEQMVGRMTETSDAMDLEGRVFKSDSPASLKRSAERSHRRKSGPLRSAMSVLNFYINRGSKNLSARPCCTLEASKIRLRQLFHRRRPND